MGDVRGMKMTAGAVLAVLPIIAIAACGLGTNFDEFTGGAKDAGIVVESGVDAPAEDVAAPPDANVAETSTIVDSGVDAAPQTYQDLVRSDKPLAYFTLDDAPNSISALESITGDLGMVNGNGITFGVPGVAGTSMHDDGTSFLDFGQILTFTGEQPWTFEVWAYPEVEDGVTFYEYFNKRDGAENGIDMYVRYESGVTTMQLEQSWHNGGRGDSLALPALDHFIHLVFTYLPGTGVRAWADGFKGNVGYDADGGPTATADSCRIAASFRGTLDEMAVYNYVLTDDQIAAHYAKGRKD